MAEWVGDERSQTLTVGSVRANAWTYGGCTVCTTIEPRGCGNMNAAKAAAEQALREMHDALSKHFAPVLRWETDGDGYSARVGKWWLSVQPEEWTVTVEGSDGPTRYEMCLRKEVTDDDRKRAAEAALRSFGVAFRTENER